MPTNFFKCQYIFTKPQLHNDFLEELLCKKFNANILENTMFQNFYNFGVN